MATLFRYSSVFLLAFFILFLTVLSLKQDEHNQIHGVVTLDMIHRDSPASPLYNASETHWQRLRNSLQRSHSGVQRYRSGKADQEFPLIYSDGAFLVNISIGTPPRPFIGIVDTGSDVIWTQCTPCKPCFNQSIPLFDPASSSTYKALSCSSKQCHLQMQPVFCSGTQSCPYVVIYKDNASTIGVLSLDTITLSSLTVPDTIFGCGHQSGGISTGVESGLVGLGRGPLSLVSQIGRLVGGRCFSHCLVPTVSTLTNPNISSKLHFGRKVSGPGVVSTPLLTNANEPSFYYIELEGISVGGNRFTPHTNSSEAFKGNIIVDSGTTLTHLPTDLYTSFEAEIRKKVHLEVVKDPDYLCYKTKNDIADVTVTFHFNGADVKLKSDNLFRWFAEDIACLVFGPTSDVGVYGNVAMTNFLVEYDLESKTVSFKSSDCMSQ